MKKRTPAIIGLSGVAEDGADGKSSSGTWEIRVRPDDPPELELGMNNQFEAYSEVG